jgi:hypothetical protein
MAVLTRPAATAALALVSIAPLPGCVEQHLEVRWDSPSFNERIRADFKPLTPEDQATDLRYGFFRDGLVDGREAGLVSEIHPAAAPGAGPGGLVQTPCLFVGTERGPGGSLAGTDELRLAWELVAYRHHDYASSEIRELFNNSDMQLGLCTLSTPGRRLLFDNPDRPPNRNGSSLTCDPDRNGGDLSLTLSKDPDDNYNISSQCVVGHSTRELVLQAVGRSVPDPDGTCPAGHFDGDRRVLDPTTGATGWYADGAWSACGYKPNHVIPSGDASYRVATREGADFYGGPAERWLSPSILHVDGNRGVVRPLETPGAGAPFAWSAKVDPPNGEGPVRWTENYTPSVQVREVAIVSRDASGAETALVPRDRVLVAAVPRPARPAAIVECRLAPDATRFRLPQDCRLSGEDGTVADVVGPLTPTYAVRFLHDTPAVTLPVAWSASLDDLPQGATAHIRFDLVARTQPARLRMSPLLDFGRRQQDRHAEGTVLVENVGGQPLRLRAVQFAAGSAHPGDFSFVLAGDPVEVPLPIQAEPSAGGGESLGLAPDADETPILVIKERAEAVDVSLGDPDRGPHPQDLTLYGERARLVGGLLLRDDPASTFAAAPPGRPFAVSAYAEKVPPFVLGPGESVRISVIARPSAPGVRSALLRVDAEPVAGGAPALWAQSLVRVDALQGPQAARAPDRIWFRRTGGPPGQGARRAALVENVGSFDLDVTQLLLQGPDASRFSVLSESGGPPLRLPSGGAADLWITYAPQCDGTYGTPTSAAEHVGTLAIRTTGGDVEIALSGSSYGFCELP